MVKARVGNLYKTVAAAVDGNEPDYWDRLSIAWEMAQTAAESYDFNRALTLTERLEATLVNVIEGNLTGSDDAQTRWEKASAAWSLSLDKVTQEMNTLKDELMEQDNIGLQEIAQFELDDLYLSFGLRITKAVNNVSRLAGSNAKQGKLASDTLDAITEFEEFLNSSGQIEAVEAFSSELKTPVSAKSTFTEAFRELQPALVLLVGLGLAV